MSAKQTIDAIKTAIGRGVATGLNNTAATALIDLRLNAPVRTGLLQRSYFVTQVATPQQWEARVSNPVFYSQWQRPFRTYKPPRVTPQALFPNSRPPYGTNGPETVDFGPVAKLLGENVGKGIGGELR